MIPGMVPILNTSTELELSLLANEQNVDVFARVGSPGSVVTVNVTVASGVVISSAAPANAAMDIIGFANGSTINLTNEGTIVGAGGAGADGSTGAEFSPGGWGFYGGGGGGGYGNVGGAGGDGVTSAGGTGTPGSAGSSVDPEVGGTAGVSATGATAEVWDQIYAAEDGGDCIEATGYYDADPLVVNLTLNILGAGNYYAGGGGGAGGYWDTNQGAQHPTDGGASGQAGEASPHGAPVPVPLPGDAGAWLRASLSSVDYQILNTGPRTGPIELVTS